MREMDRLRGREKRQIGRRRVRWSDERERCSIKKKEQLPRRG